MASEAIKVEVGQRWRRDTGDGAAMEGVVTGKQNEFWRVQLGNRKAVWGLDHGYYGRFHTFVGWAPGFGPQPPQASGPAKWEVGQRRRGDIRGRKLGVLDFVVDKLSAPARGKMSACWIVRCDDGSGTWLFDESWPSELLPASPATPVEAPPRCLTCNGVHPAPACPPGWHGAKPQGKQHDFSNPYIIAFGTFGKRRCVDCGDTDGLAAAAVCIPCPGWREAAEVGIRRFMDSLEVAGNSPPPRQPFAQSHQLRCGGVISLRDEGRNR